MLTLPSTMEIWRKITIWFSLKVLLSSISDRNKHLACKWEIVEVYDILGKYKLSGDCFM